MQTPETMSTTSLSAVAAGTPAMNFLRPCILRAWEPSVKNSFVVFGMQPEIYLVKSFFALPYSLASVEIWKREAAPDSIVLINFFLISWYCLK